MYMKYKKYSYEELYILNIHITEIITILMIV